MIKYSNISIFKEKPEEKLKEALPPPNEDVLNGTHDNGYRKKYTGKEFDKLCCLFDRPVWRRIIYLNLEFFWVTPRSCLILNRTSLS